MMVPEQDLPVPGIVLHDPLPHALATVLDHGFLPSPAIDAGARMDRVRENPLDGP